MAKQTEVERYSEFFEYLDDLRASGVTNMFGARPYLLSEFIVSAAEASAVLSAWMESDLSLSPTERAERALQAA